MFGLDKVVWRIRGNSLIRQLAFRALSHPLLSGNSLYQSIYEKKIRKLALEYIKYPHAISIESTNRCNANCWLCPHKYMTRPKGTMTQDVFENIVDQVYTYPGLCMFLSGFGEPLLDLELEKKCAYAKSKGVYRVSFYTNGQLLTQERAKDLVDAGIDAIDVSIDSGNPQAFADLRKGLDFGVIIENVRKLADLRRNGKPFITIDMLTLRGKSEESDKLSQLLSGSYDRLVIRHPDNWIGSVEVPANAKTIHRPVPPKCRPPCKHLWDMMVVYWDGSVPLCCHDFNAEQIMGNVRNESIEDVWRNHQFEYYREANLAHDFSHLKLCNKCDFFTIWW
jgi:radical SAM protein with 4Fe4S-binding SPASM domain